jgi:hypothetical protein
MKYILKNTYIHMYINDRLNILYFGKKGAHCLLVVGIASKAAVWTAAFSL